MMGRPKIFGEPVDMTFRAEATLKKALEYDAAHYGATLSGRIRAILQEHIDSKAPRKT